MEKNEKDENPSGRFWLLVSLFIGSVFIRGGVDGIIALLIEVVCAAILTALIAATVAGIGKVFLDKNFEKIFLFTAKLVGFLLWLVIFFEFDGIFPRGCSTY